MSSVARRIVTRSKLPSIMMRVSTGVHSLASSGRFCSANPEGTMPIHSPSIVSERGGAAGAGPANVISLAAASGTRRI